MKPKICPECKNYMNEDDSEFWCAYCDYEEQKEITIHWKWSEE